MEEVGVIAPFVRVDLSVAPVLLLLLHEHKALLSLGSLIKVFSLLLSAPVGSLNSAIAPVLLLGKGELWDWWFSSIDLPSSLQQHCIWNPNGSHCHIADTTWCYINEVCEIGLPL